MMPPADTTVLERNPRFKALYENLRSQKLTPDGATKDLKKEKRKDELMQKLDNARKAEAKEEILCDSLDLASKKNIGLPPELIEVVSIVSAQLQGHVSAEDRLLLEDDVDHFLANMPPTAHTLSTHLTAITQYLGSLVDVPAADLPITATALREIILEQTQSISSTRLSIAALTTQLQRHERTLLESLIRVLEQVIHGSVARHTRARAEHLALVAEGLTSKSQIMALNQTASMDPKLREALKAYEKHLDQIEGDLTDQEAKLREQVEAYEKGGRGMVELARKRKETQRLMEEVKGEIERLERR